MLKGSTTQNYGSVYHPGVNSDYGYADDVEEEEVPEWPGPKLTSKFVFQNSIKSSVAKGELPWAKTLLLAIMAGCYISFGNMLAIVVGGGVPNADPGIQKFLYGLVFPVGLMLVVISGAELVTSSLALLPAGVLERKVTIWQLLKSWCVSYIGNLAGALFLSYVIMNSGLLEAEPWLTFVKTATYNKVNLPFLQVLTRGFLCNWLVCLAVWNSNGANDLTGKVVAIWPAIMAFSAMGYEHSVANMFMLPLGWGLGADVSMSAVFLNNILPVTLGNILGGCFMVALVYSTAYGKTGKQIAKLSNRLTKSCTSGSEPMFTSKDS